MACCGNKLSRPVRSPRTTDIASSNTNNRRARTRLARTATLLSLIAGSGSSSRGFPPDLYSAPQKRPSDTPTPPIPSPNVTRTASVRPSRRPPFAPRGQSPSLRPISPFMCPQLLSRRAISFATAVWFFRGNRAGLWPMLTFPFPGPNASSRSDTGGQKCRSREGARRRLARCLQGRPSLHLSIGRIFMGRCHPPHYERWSLRAISTRVPHESVLISTRSQPLKVRQPRWPRPILRDVSFLPQLEGVAADRSHDAGQRPPRRIRRMEYLGARRVGADGAG